MFSTFGSMIATPIFLQTMRSLAQNFIVGKSGNAVRRSRQHNGSQFAVRLEMRFLVLAYGAEKDWKGLSKSDQDELLAQDEYLRKRGALVAAVDPAATTVKAWDGTASTTNGPFAQSTVPLAGFGVIEAADLEEAIRLVTNTPCARARGAVELRPIIAINE